MATTTNYGWTTPDDTALVKDGAAAIRTLGSSVDSTLKTQIDAQIAKTIVDAKGDIIAATAADTVSRLAVGANDTVLTADSTTATGLKWGTVQAGGMTLISTTSLSGATVTLSSIPSTYKNLQLVIRNFKPASDGNSLYLRLNGDTATRYVTFGWNVTSGDETTFNAGDIGPALNNVDNSSAPNLMLCNIWDYTNTVTWKMGSLQGVNESGGNPGQVVRNTLNFYYNQTAAISSITILPGTGNITSGTALLYGVS
jgi:hypothetical protein